jgi:hypothetical protein
MTILSTEILPLTLMLPSRRTPAETELLRRRAEPPSRSRARDQTRLAHKREASRSHSRFLRVLVGSALACARRPIIWKVKKLRERVGYMIGKATWRPLTPARRSHNAMFWRQFIHIYGELIFGCDNFK